MLNMNTTAFKIIFLFANIISINFSDCVILNLRDGIVWTQREVMNMIKYIIEKFRKLKSIAISNPTALMELLSTTNLKLCSLSNLYLKPFDRSNILPPTSQLPLLEKIHLYFTEILLHLHFFKSCLDLSQHLALFSTSIQVAQI